MKTLWRGIANAWECDELGHMNVRFYLAKADEAIAMLCEDIGMRGAYAPNAMAYLRPLDMTVRFLAEARPGAILQIRGGVTDITDTGVELALILDHCLKDTPAASFVIRLDHVSPHTGEAFNWSSRSRECLEALKVDMPKPCQTRSLDLTANAEISADRASALGMEQVSRGMVFDHETNVHGEMRLEFGFGKVSDGVFHLTSAFADLAEDYRRDGPLQNSSAVLEAKLNFHRFPTAGTSYAMYSGLSHADEKIRTLVHWITDNATGGPLWSMQAVSCTMDLQARKMKRLDGQALADAKANVIPELTA